MKTQTKFLKTKSLLLMSISALLLASCTKDIPFENLKGAEKIDDVPREMFDEDSENLMSISMLNASRTSTDALPFSSGDNKRVKIKLTKKSLQILETERDERYSANKANDKLVVEIPAEYARYQCAKDRFGECTNKEEDSGDADWETKPIVRLKLDNIKITEMSFLPIFESQTMGDNCYTQTSGRLVSSKIEKDAINLTVEATFLTNLACLSELDKVSDATVTANYHISLVKLSSVVSKGYKTISYPEGSKDEQTFGFFSSKAKVLDVDNNNTDKSTVQIMNRWNPERSEIVYYLSDEFAKPENKLVKDLTYKTVSSLNEGLAEAGVKFRINLKDPAGKVPGDIRNSMIVLVEDPVAASIIGYGPQTEDPVTGEIISARTVMFLGTIKKYIKYTYDEILREKKDKLATKAVPIKLADALVQKTTALKQTGKVFNASDLSDSIISKIKGGEAKAKLSKIAGPGANFGQVANLSLKALRNYTAQKNPEFSGTDLKSQLKYLMQAKNCSFAPAVEGASGGISGKLMSEFANDAKPWEQLSDSEKEKAIAIILPEIWIPTLIHEMGHNLGLRHNFAASEDKPNYLSQTELSRIGSDHVIPFSSVMDYGNDLKTLPVLGKYDIAALKFGYNREVEVQAEDGTASQVAVPSTLLQLSKELEAKKQTLKEYQFCTDEHVGINAGCKRFDLGSSYTEIVENLIKDYESAYTKRNLRDGRASMSLMDDLSYASRINYTFREMRVMMEVVERIKHRFQIADDAPEWESVAFLKDLKQATLLGGSFMNSVLLVPDTLCAVASADNLNEIIAVVPLVNINAEAISCFKLQLDPKFVVVGQGGKMFNSQKDPDSTNAWADQIDVRGIWIDKILAMRALTDRTIGVLSMDEKTDNFLNQPELRQGIMDTVKGFMTNNVVNKVDFTLLDGSKATFEIDYDMSSTQVIKRPMIMDMVVRGGAPKEYVQKIANRLGVRVSGTTPLQETIASQLAYASLDQNDSHEQDKAIYSAMSVFTMNSALNQKISKTAKAVVIDQTTYVADQANTLAQESMANIVLASTLEKVPQEKVLEIFKAKLAKQPQPPKATTEEKAVWKLSEEVLQNYLMGVLKTAAFYKNLLQILPSSQLL